MDSDISQYLEHDAVQSTRGEARIAVVLVNWNGSQDTLAAYESLKASTYPHWEVICVDNASSDQSVEVLREVPSQFHLIESRANLGFAGGCNLAIEAAERRGATHVYLLNNDATVTDRTLEMLVEASRSLNDDCVLGTIIRVPSDGSLQFWGSQESHERLPLWFSPSEELLAQAPDFIDTDFILGASLFIPMPILERIGNLDERYFLNYEETDWCYRARRENYRCVVLKHALALHEGGAAIGNPDGPLQVYFMRRNRLLFCERNANRGTFALLLLRQLGGSILRLLKTFKPGCSRELALVYRAHALGTLDYVRRRFGDCPAVVRKMAQEYRALAKT